MAFISQFAVLGLDQVRHFRAHIFSEAALNHVLVQLRNDNNIDISNTLYYDRILSNGNNVNVIIWQNAPNETLNETPGNIGKMH